MTPNEFDTARFIRGGVKGPAPAERLRSWFQPMAGWGDVLPPTKPPMNPDAVETGSVYRTDAGYLWTAAPSGPSSNSNREWVPALPVSARQLAEGKRVHQRIVAALFASVFGAFVVFGGVAVSGGVVDLLRDVASMIVGALVVCAALLLAMLRVDTNIRRAVVIDDDDR